MFDILNVLYFIFIYVFMDICIVDCQMVCGHKSLGKRQAGKSYSDVQFVYIVECFWYKILELDTDFSKESHAYNKSPSYKKIFIFSGPRYYQLESEQIPACSLVAQEQEKYKILNHKAKDAIYKQ